MADKRTFKIAMGGIFLALTMVFLFGASFVPGIELALFAVSSVFVVAMIIESGVLGGCILYIGALLLGFLVIPNKLALLPYLCIFGLYPIIKFAMEKIKSKILQYSLKILFLGGVLSVSFLGFKELLLGGVHIPEELPVAVILIAGTAFLLLYDQILTQIELFYRRKIKRQKPKPPPDIKLYDEKEQ